MKKHYQKYICASDLHFTFTPPKCREVEEYIEAQDKKIDFLLDLQRKEKAPILCGGDIFDRWNASPELLSYLIYKLQEADFPIITIPGQHDLPNHNIKEYDRSGLSVLEASGVLTVIKDPNAPIAIGQHLIFGKPWGLPLPEAKKLNSESILILHEGIYKKEKPFPNCKWRTSKQVIEESPGFKLIVSGDNHKPFTHNIKGSYLINPGSMMRMHADQADFDPRVYIYDFKTGCAEQVYIPIEPGIVSREHIISEEERDQRISDFVEHLKTKYNVTIDFKKNMEVFLSSNRVRKSTKEWVWRALD